MENFANGPGLIDLLNDLNRSSLLDLREQVLEWVANELCSISRNRLNAGTWALGLLDKFPDALFKFRHARYLI